MGMIWVPDIAGRLAHSVEFFMDCRPRGWKRGSPFVVKGSRFARIHDPEENQVYKDLIRHKLMSALVRQSFSLDLLPWSKPNPVAIYVHALFRPGKSVRHWVGREHTQDPDASNVLKLVEDALFRPTTRGKDTGLYLVEDDCQMIRSLCTKQWYHRNGTVVRVELYNAVGKPKGSRCYTHKETDRYGYPLPR